MKFYEAAFACFIDEAVSVHSKSLNHAQRSWNCPIGHDPHDHVHALWGERNEIPEGIMRRSCLRKPTIRLHFHRVNKIRKLDRILDKEDGDVIPDKIIVSFICVEFD